MHRLKEWKKAPHRLWIYAWGWSNVPHVKLWTKSENLTQNLMKNHTVMSRDYFKDSRSLLHELVAVATNLVSFVQMMTYDLNFQPFLLKIHPFNYVKGPLLDSIWWGHRYTQFRYQITDLPACSIILLVSSWLSSLRL